MGSGLSFVLFLPLLCYLLTILILHLPIATNKTENTNNSTLKPHVAIVTVMRNEAQNIQRLLDDLHKQKYPIGYYHIYIVDDHSTDCSVDIVAQYQSEITTLIQLPDEVRTKKRAVSFVMNTIKEPYVLFTDADCSVGKLWLSSMMKPLLENETLNMVTGPVHISSYIEKKTNKSFSFFQRIQYLELSAMMYITKQGIVGNYFHLANGANMALRTHIYHKVTSGMRYDLASGDDTFLIQEIEKQWPGSTVFSDSLESIVKTSGETTIGGFINQRLRWASKSVAMERKSILVFQSVTWIAMLGMIISFCAIPWFGVTYFLVYFSVITVLDTSLLLAYHKLIDFRWIDFIVIPLTVIFHACYVVVVGLLSLVSPSYSWKGRNLR